MRGLAQYRGVVEPLIGFLLDQGIGIYQMPCPESTCLGNMRWGYVKDQYDNPMFRKHCERLTEVVMDQIQDYQRCGYHVLGFVMVDGSPVCGLHYTPRPIGDTLWGGMVWYSPESHHVLESGVFSEILQQMLKERGIEIPFIAYPELEEFGRLEDTLATIKSWIS